MKIIIIGEFSSFSKNLSKGFREIGHDCFVFSWGDSFKKITQDENKSYTINASFEKGSVIDYLLFQCKSFLEMIKLKLFVYRLSKKNKYDAVLIINPTFIKERWKFWQARFSKSMIKSLLENRNNIYLSACGSDTPYYDYWHHFTWKNDAAVKSCEPYITKSRIRHHQYVVSFVKKIIPVTYCYAQAWRYSQYTKKCIVLPTIPLPIDCDNIQFENAISEKIIVFHGLIRPKAKGSSHIVEAMERLQENYPEKVKCIVDGGMPLNDYLKLLFRVNILIDQAVGDYVGMNGLYGLAMGKVVFGGNELDNQKELNEFDCPIVNIYPDSKQIYEELEQLILNPQSILDMSKKSRAYVERVHDAKIIAQRYIETLNDNNE